MRKTITRVIVVILLITLVSIVDIVYDIGNLHWTTGLFLAVVILALWEFICDFIFDLFGW